MTDESLLAKPTKRRPRHIRSPDNLRPIRLTRRDLDILYAVGDYRVLSTTQLKKLFFRSIHKARKRLFKLWQHRLLDRRFQPIRIGESPSETLYVLARQGARIMALQSGSLGGASQLTPFDREGSSLFLDHTLARNDFRIALESAVRFWNGVRQCHWRHDKGIEQSVNIITGSSAPRLQRVTLIADGQFRLQLGNHVQEFYVEIDRGTIALSRWKTRVSAYSALFRQKQKSSVEVPFLVLVTTPSERRARHIGQVARSIRLSGNPTFFFTTQGSWNLNTEGIIEALIWSCYRTGVDSRQSPISLKSLVADGMAAVPAKVEELR